MPADSVPSWGQAIDWPRVLREARRKNTTYKQLHREVAADVVSYWSFWRHMRKLLPDVQAQELTLRRQHKPGEKVEVDYADGIDLVDRLTSEITKTHLFWGVLPFSSYVFGEFVLNQKLAFFIDSHERMWAAFDGVTPYVVPDNLKSGVKKAHRYDPEINPTYCDYGNHTGFAVLPARPRRPRDKASVEAGIGVVQRTFYAEVRNRSFYSLAELNAAFRQFLQHHNQREMKDLGVSRLQRFEEERKVLKSLPSQRYQIQEWRHAKVHPECHVQVMRTFYSVPHTVVGQTVRVCIGVKLLEIYGQDAPPVAVHLCQEGKGRFSTDDVHYPDRKLGIKRFEVKVAASQAEKIGPHTHALVNALISADYPLRHLRRIQGILRLLSDSHVSAQDLEYACHMAKQHHKPHYSFIKACAEHHRANGANLGLVRPERDQASMYLHQKPFFTASDAVQEKTHEH